MLNEYKDVMTVLDVAQALGVCKDKIYQLLKSNELKSKRVGTKYIIPKFRVIEFIEKTT
jgi:DNA binding domain, excisionase family